MAAPDSTAEAVLFLEKLDHALLAQNTHKGYRADWRIFRRWCDSEGLAALPATPETLALYIAVRLTMPRKVSTVRRHVCAIGYMHKRAGLDSPVTAHVCELLRGARRLRQERVRQMKPLTLDDLRAIAAALAVEDTPIAARDRAIVLVGFASALRSASLVDLTLQDAEFGEKGLTLAIRREKTDQEGKGRLIGVPFGHNGTCPVAALQAWVARRGSYAGPLFTVCNGGDTRRAMQAEQVCRIVQGCLVRIGRDPDGYGSHSIRSGFVTAAGEQNVSDLLIAAQTGHRDIATLRGYFRRTDVFRANACAMLGL
jgi:integrase